jgi:hypothetical protein
MAEPELRLAGHQGHSLAADRTAGTRRAAGTLNGLRSQAGGQAPPSVWLKDLFLNGLA